MTISTSADVKEIQDRNAAARGRVIAAGHSAVSQWPKTEDPDGYGYASQIIEAAMMELAAVWREEAEHVTHAGRKGHISIAKEYTQAAARLAGFAVGLTTRPVDEIAKTAGRLLIPHEDAILPEVVMQKCEHPEDAWSTLRDGTSKCTACGAEIAMGTNYVILNDPHRPQCDCGRPECVALSLAEALPAGDPVAAVFTSPTRVNLPDLVTAAPGPAGPTGGWVAPIPAQLMGDEPIGTQITVGGIDFTKIATSPFGVDQSEEQSLRDIIGPLGASNVTATIDHPFTNPSVPWLNKKRAVETIPFHELSAIAIATPPRDHVSHSYVESYESCSLSAMLRDASRMGHIGATRPMWGGIGGQAFHSAVETIERMALSNIHVVDDLESFWLQAFEAKVKEQVDALVGTPYADSATWYLSNRGKEGFDWWRVEGARMLGLYVKHHTPEWRAANATFRVQDTTPVIEFEYDMTIRSLDGERGLRAKGFVDRATLDMSSYSLTVLDYKTGSREPESTFQLGEYGHALLMAMGIAQEPADRPILGRYWLARKGIYTDPIPVVTRHPLAELQYRYDNADRGTRAKIFSPHVTNLCKSCPMTDYCPTQASRS